MRLIPCVGAIIRDADGRLLLIKRGHEPGSGLWSIPGGRVQPGESDAEALVREVREETGLTVTPGALVGTVQRPGTRDSGTRDSGTRDSGTRDSVFVIRDYAAEVTGGALTPGDDADDARWVSRADFGGLPLTSGLAEALSQWGV